MRTSSGRSRSSHARRRKLISRVTADTDRLWEFIAFGVVDVSLSS